jgi:hypothetical protein
LPLDEPLPFELPPKGLFPVEPLPFEFPPKVPDPGVIWGRWKEVAALFVVEPLLGFAVSRPSQTPNEPAPTSATVRAVTPRLFHWRRGVRLGVGVMVSGALVFVITVLTTSNVSHRVRC